MNAPSEDIKDMLVADGIGTFQTDLYIAMMPNVPDACISIYDTPGEGPEAGAEYHRDSVMIHIRGDNSSGGYTSAYNTAESIRNALHKRTESLSSGTEYVGVWARTSIMFLEYDERNRPKFSLNFTIHRTI